MAEAVGIIGLGHMGMVAARKYIEAGYTVYGYARRQEAIDQFTSFGGKHVANATEVAEKSDKVIVYVLNDAQVIDVVTGEEGILAGKHESTGVICMATIDRKNLEMVASECAKRGVGFIDCPVTGGPARVEAGTLTLIVSGDANYVEECRDILEVQGSITFIGEEPGLGQAVKHCNQLLVGTTQAATMEVITLARQSGLDPRLVCDVVGSGVGGSDYFRIMADCILGDKPSVGGLGQMIKDVGLVVNDARETGIPLFVVNAAYQYFLAAKAQGLEYNGTEDLIKVLEKMSNP
jgi:3-hydroxyisobutyrate dehydrogenase-like beta-hydroxyacid dehydrogenase